jgi:hypothetical protein
MERLFTGAETWHGGFYELAMEFGAEAESTLERALQALWEFPDLRGCYLRRDQEPSTQPRMAATFAAQASAGHLVGMATVPGGIRVACGTVLVREDNGNRWLDFYLPLGALAAAYDVGAYPFDENLASRQWREPLEKWLADIGQAVYAKTPFRLGLVGFEVSGTVSSHDLEKAGAPSQRFIGYLYPSTGTLTWYPTNQWQQQTLRAS